MFSSYFANRQTNRSAPAVRYPPPLAEVLISLTAELREALYPIALLLPTWARLQRKTAVTMPYSGQRNVSIFSQWIQGWFVWILLINCSRVNYWCSGVRPAFWMTDGQRYQVILHLPPPMLQLQSSQRISILCLPSPQTSPFSLSLPLCWRLLLTAFVISVISTHTCYHLEISLWLCLFTSCSVIAFPLFFLSFCRFRDISAANFLVPGMSELRGAPIYSFVTLVLPFSFPLFTLVSIKSFTHAGYLFLTQ